MSELKLHVSVVIVYTEDSEGFNHQYTGIAFTRDDPDNIEGYDNMAIGNLDIPDNEEVTEVCIVKNPQIDFIE